ncbi:MAG: sensor histidine kinase [Pseudomonadota bacterium]|nr:sensor histidine kinase [Pseudomonadota bacterium]MDQ2704089.1 sensor histidine kinase [Pseudomonadota bacterium]
MRILRKMLDRWRTLTLTRQFLLAGTLVSVVAMLGVGALVAGVIERSLIRHAGSTTALYVDSVIAPLLPDMRTVERLDDVIAHALDETLAAGRLSERLLSYRLWRGDGTILYANRPELIGKRFDPNPELRTAFSGQVVAEYGLVDDAESSFEQVTGERLLEIYSPIRQPWTGEVVAVSEFYERVPDFAQALHLARLKGWAAVAAVTLGLFLTLAAIVLRGSATIEAQRRALKRQVEEQTRLAKTNELLAIRAETAFERAAAFNEQFLRRLGADLHDGPAQLVAFAALRLGSRVLRDGTAPEAARDGELNIIKASLADAMEEIRTISAGLVLPHIETASLAEVLAAAVKAHERRTKSKVALIASANLLSLDTAVKTCAFRFVQEGLANAFRHAGGKGVSVSQSHGDGCLSIEVADQGPGFDASAVGQERLGLACLRQRVESLGGTMVIASGPKGTRLTMLVALQDNEVAEWAA